jgi:hypothetical protein
MNAKEYFDKEYGNGHIETVVIMDDVVSLYLLIEEYHQAELDRFSHNRCNSCGNTMSNDCPRCTRLWES